MAKRTGPIRVTSLLLLVFRQSLRFQVWLLTKDKTKGFPKHEAQQMKADLASDLLARALEVAEVDWAAVHQQAEQLSERHTEKKRPSFRRPAPRRHRTASRRRRVPHLRREPDQTREGLEDEGSRLTPPRSWSELNRCVQVP